jgi:acyl carrier protein
MTDSASRIIDIVAQVMETGPDTLSPDTAVRGIPGASSIKMLEVVLATEAAFDIAIPDEVTFNIDTIGDFRRIVDELCGAPASLSGAA